MVTTICMMTLVYWIMGKDKLITPVINEKVECTLNEWFGVTNEIIKSEL